MLIAIRMFMLSKAEDMNIIGTSDTRLISWHQ